MLGLCLGMISVYSEETPKLVEHQWATAVKQRAPLLALHLAPLQGVCWVRTWPRAKDGCFDIT